MKKAVITGNRQAEWWTCPTRGPRTIGPWSRCMPRLARNTRPFCRPRNCFTTGHEGAGEVVAVSQPAGAGGRPRRVLPIPVRQCDLCLAGDTSTARRPGFRARPRHADGSGTFAQYVPQAGLAAAGHTR